MRRLSPAVLVSAALAFAGGAVQAAPDASDVTVAVGNSFPAARPIPEDFVGLSFEISNLLPDRDGTRMFSAEDRPLIALFRAAGVRNLRVGGGTAEDRTGRIPVPREADIDALFAFARAADLRVIYTLRLLQGDMDLNARLAAYIMAHDADRLEYFQIGNEPDWHAYHWWNGHVLDPHITEAQPGVPGSAYPSYLADWRRFAAAILKAAPNAKFGGPDTGSDYPLPKTKDTDFEGKSWTERFAHDEKASGDVVAALAHDYPGQDARGVPVQTGIDSILSAQWHDEFYRMFWRHALAPTLAQGLGYRMTECNDYTGGVEGSSNAFASALWALDYMHWQAAHGAIGVNFHNRRWIWTDTIYRSPDGVYHLNPKAYALRAFDLMCGGTPLRLKLENPAGLNVTAYAVRGSQGLLVTVINKEHGANARPARVTLVAGAAAPGGTSQAEPRGGRGQEARLEVMTLSAADGSPRARTGITLGGSALTDDGRWDGRWSPLSANVLSVAPVSAVIVRIPQ